MKNNGKKGISTRPISQRTYMRINPSAGTAHIERWLSQNDKQVLKYNLNYIDEDIGAASNNFQVIGRHYGHDHGYGICHLHHHSSPIPANLGNMCGWVSCVERFVQDVHSEILSFHKFVPHAFSVDTLEGLLNCE